MNTLITPGSGNISFSSLIAAGSDYLPPLSASARIAYTKDGGLTIVSTASSSERFNVEGNFGSLLTVNDSATGRLLVINDVSGFPLFFITDNGTVSSASVIYASAGNSDSWSSVYSTTQSNSANWILDGGNTKGANISIGANDGYSLLLKTSNATCITIATIGTSDNTVNINAKGIVIGGGTATPVQQGGTGSPYGYAITLGSGTATGFNSIVFGGGTASSTSLAGHGATASGLFSVAIGQSNTLASGANALAIGVAAKARGTSSVALGANIDVLHDNSFGWGSEPYNEYVPAPPTFTTRTGQFMVSARGGVYFPGKVGIGTDDNTNSLTVAGTISGNNITTSFNQGSATGDLSFAIGTGKAFGAYSYAEGYNTLASGDNSHAEGDGTLASGGSSHAEGSNTVASGPVSHTEGGSTVARGFYAHAEGFGTLADGGVGFFQGCAHAEGLQTAATGIASHAEGYQSIAGGNYSHAAGWYATAVHNNTWVWNSDPNALTNNYQVSSTRTGQFAVSATGGVYFPGNVGIGTDSNENALTVVGNISTNAYYSSKEWADAYTNLVTNSANYLSGASTSYVNASFVKLSGDNMTGLLTNSVGISSFSLSARSIDLVHQPANDGTNPVLRIGEYDTTGGNVGFSGMHISYDETTNVFGISAQFAPAAGIPAICIDRNANVGARSFVVGPAFNSLFTTTPVSAVSGMYVEPVSGYAGFHTNTPVAPVDIRGSTKIIGFSAFGNDPTCLRMRDDYLYVLCRSNNTLNVFDTSTSVPQFVASAATNALGFYSTLAIQGKYAYVTTTAGIQSFDVSAITPVSAGIVGTQSNGGTNFTSPGQIVTQGKYAYATYYAPGFPNQSVYNVVDISDPTKLSHAISTPNNVLGGNSNLAIQGNNLYYGFSFIGGNGVFQFNLATKPVPTSGDAIQIQQSTVSSCIGMAAQGRYVYYSGASAFFVIDTTRSGLDRIVATLTLDNMFTSTFFDMVIQRQYAYVLRASGIYIINISNPRRPVIVQRITISLSTSSYRGMVIRGRYLYFTDGNAFAIYRIDLGGSYVQQLEAGGIHTENMYSSNVYAANEIAAIGGGSFGGGLNVQGAANVQGGLSVTPASGTQTFSNYFSVVSSNPATTLTVFAVTNTNRVGIGTASPNSALTVVGDMSATRVIYSAGGDMAGPLTVTGSLSTTQGIVCAPSTFTASDTVTDAALIMDFTRGASTGGMYVRRSNGQQRSIFNYQDSAGNIDVGTFSNNINSVSIKAGGSNLTGYVNMGTFTTNNAMRIIDNGKIGVGTITPVEKLTVVGNISCTSVIYSSGGNSNFWNRKYVLITSNFSIDASSYYAVNTTGGVVRATLPTSPTFGDTVTFIDPYYTWGSNNFELQRTDQPIEGFLEPLSADVAGYNFAVTYVGGTYGWRVI